MPDPEKDPNAGKISFVGRRISFDAPDPADPSRKIRLKGMVLTQEFIGRTERGRIPNYRVRVQGRSGRTMDVDLVESYAVLED